MHKLKRSPESRELLFQTEQKGETFLTRWLREQPSFSQVASFLTLSCCLPLQVGFVVFQCPAMQNEVGEPTKLKFSLHL